MTLKSNNVLEVTEMHVRAKLY